MLSGKSSNSMRDNYGTHGVENYYRMVQESYRNPHYLGLKRVLTQFMDQYVAQEKPKRIKVLDLAAGSGEATEILLQWKAARWPSAAPPPATAPPASTEPPAAPAPSASSLASPASASPLPSRPPFIPPARQFPQRAVSRPTRPSAQPSLPAPELSIVATDPYTAPAYRARTGLPCSELSFADVAAGKLPAPGATEPPAEGGEDVVEPFDLVVISFALHLVETSSELWALLDQLSKRARWLCVTAPHKKPDVKDSWGWRRWDPSSAWKPADGTERVGGEQGDGAEIVLERVRLRPRHPTHLGAISFRRLAVGCSVAMSALPRAVPVPRDLPARALVLVDGNAVLPDRSNLLRGAQGGGLASYALHENLRRAVSQHCGRECHGTVMLFADIPQLAIALRIPAEVLSQFSRGFSSTSTPSTFVNVMQGSTLSTMNGHLAFHARAIDYVVLVGWTTDMHAHWLSNLVPTTLVNLSNVLRVETAQPAAPSLVKLVPKSVRFHGLMDAMSAAPPVRDITDPPSDHEEGEGIDHEEIGASPREPAKKANGGTIATPQPAPSTPTRAPSTRSSSIASSPDAALRSIPGVRCLAPSLLEEPPQLDKTAAQALPLTPPRPSAGAGAPAAAAAPAFTFPSARASASTSPPAPAPSPAPVALPRPPPVPEKYLPLLRTLLSLSPLASSPPALWSAVGTQLQRDGALPATKLSVFFGAAQKDGWVSTGRGDKEGREWVRISARGRRAMGRG
ncbi:hypothetical protein DMC30DRAFT_348554 [Rhodotorula diobovata]|uniref:DUF7923 domain-containing protein n=1 Tax=Rhodotorula diobovata TaxID=5288 RepID=A0A5C5G2U3_9BASI|nr:hypothetical protein DMC30DRAFT_348554 [Rhodotorula diobovata]